MVCGAREDRGLCRGTTVDDEAKTTFGEALNAHEAGFYRSVCRVLMPEIERVSRVELHGDRLERITPSRCSASWRVAPA